jgi:large subunit ribosomal protein L14e
MVTYGPDYGKLAVIVEIVDHGRVLVEGAEVKRQVLSFKRVSLTAIKINIPRAIGSVKLLAQVEKQDIKGQFAKTSWAKKIDVREKRQSLNDFDRFKVMLARKKTSTVVGKKFAKIRKAHK